MNYYSAFIEASGFSAIFTGVSATFALVFADTLAADFSNPKNSMAVAVVSLAAFNIYLDSTRLDSSNRPPK